MQNSVQTNPNIVVGTILYLKTKKVIQLRHFVLRNKIIIIISLICLNTALMFSQNSDNKYQKPLKEILEEIQERYDVTIKYSDDLVKDKWITYAIWRYRPGIELTLKNVLAPVDLIYSKQGEKKYKIKKFEYHRWPLDEAKEQANYLASKYSDKESWEIRKQGLKKCMWQALKLSGLPEWPNSRPVITHKRSYDGYRVENIALEVLPGVYTFGSVYKPINKSKGGSPIVLCPNGHWWEGRYRKNHQIRCAMLAKMGAHVVSYDLFAWGESMLQFSDESHHKSLAMTIQVLNSFRFLDYLVSLKDTDNERIGIVGGSGGGSHAMLITALDDRIKVSVPTVMLSAHMYGGCPCESGMPVHLCGNGTNNVEISSMAAPRPQLIISDGKDWTANVPELEYPLVKRVYNFYGKDNLVSNKHFPKEGHDFGPSKRQALYNFIVPALRLETSKIRITDNKYDESAITIEEKEALYVIENKAENLPDIAIKSFEELETVFEEYIAKKK